LNAIALDVHCHLVPVNTGRLARIADIAWHSDRHLMEIDGSLLQPKSLYAPADLITWMDKNNIERAWVSVPPMVYRQSLEPQSAIAWFSYLNDGLVEICAQFPARLQPMFHLPVEHPEHANAIACRWAAEGHARFAMASGAGPGVVLSDDRYDALWATLNAAKAFLFLHPADSCDGRLHPFYLLNLVGNPFETAVAASHLVFGRVLERFPDMTVCLAHCGGATAMLAGRMQRGLDTSRPGVNLEMQAPRLSVRQLFVDSIAHDADTLAFAGEIFGRDHIVFGSDWPFPMGLPDPHAQLSQLNAPERERIFVDNARVLLKRHG
jgi:aminocarboxymuconate-semialdehyde decarboxylase